MMTMKNYFTNSCGKRRGCFITALPHDGSVGLVLSGVHETEHDLSQVLFMADLSLDKELAQEGQVEKMAA